MAAAREPLYAYRVGTLAYRDAAELQAGLREARRSGEVGDTLLILEHYPVFTMGRRTERGELGMGEEWYRMQGIEVCATDRGGRVTYHGPGQLVAYPIVDLAGYEDDVGAHVRRLERVMIESLDRFGVRAQVIEGLTGVWTAGDPPLAPGSPGPQGAPVGEAEVGAGTGGARKIGSIGVRVSHGVTTHGLAVNVDNDLQPFNWIVPCGIEAAQPTSLARELGQVVDLAQFAEVIEERFGAAFERRVVRGERLLGLSR